jgi:hypothetical protein
MAGRRGLRPLLVLLTCAPVALGVAGCAVSGHGQAIVRLPSAAALAESPTPAAAARTSPTSRRPSAGRSTGAPARAAARSTAGATASSQAQVGNPPAPGAGPHPTQQQTRGSSSAPPPARNSSTTHKVSPPRSTRNGPVGVSGDGGVVAAINAYRQQAHLPAIPGYFSQSAQNCAIKNLPSFTGHCLRSGIAGEVYAEVPSQSGSAAASLWYGEGPGTGPSHEHYNIIMSSHVTAAYYGWAYDAASGFYDVIIDFTAAGGI